MPLGVTIMERTDVSPLDKLLIGSNGLLRTVPAAEVKAFPWNMIMQWCVERGVYQIPTQELMDFLATEIGSLNTIEIASGNGVIGRHLNLIMTDSYIQTTPEMAAYYRACGQEPITPPPDVIKMDANSAVNHYKPHAVIGSWVTQKYADGDKDGSVFGVDELDILRKVVKYIHVGNDGPHGSKRSLKYPHKVYRFDWLVSRGQDQKKNNITVYSGQQP